METGSCENNYELAQRKLLSGYSSLVCQDKTMSQEND